MIIVISARQNDRRSPRRRRLTWVRCWPETIMTCEAPSLGMTVSSWHWLRSACACTHTHMINVMACFPSVMEGVSVNYNSQAPRNHFSAGRGSRSNIKFYHVTWYVDFHPHLLKWQMHLLGHNTKIILFRKDSSMLSITGLDNIHCAEQQLSCHAAAASRMAVIAELTHGPQSGWAHNGHIIFIMLYANVGTWTQMY